MFNPYQNFFESFYFYQLNANSPYFNYDQCFHPVKISSNIVLTENQFRQPQKNSIEEKFQQTKADSYLMADSFQKQKNDLTKKLKSKTKIPKQKFVLKKKRVSKQVQKMDLVQKQGRNSHSNILRKFFKLLSVKNQFTPILEKIISKYGFEVSIDDFFETMKAKNIDHRNYIRIKQVGWLFSNNQNPCNKMARILFQSYMSNYYVEHLLSSKKTDNKSVVFHLKGRRTIKEEILGYINKKFDQNQEGSVENSEL